MEPFMLTEKPGSDAGLLHLAKWEAFEGITAGFSTRNGGVSAPPRQALNTALHVGDEASDVIANRKLVAEALGWNFAAWTCAEQVHGNRVHAVTSADAGRGRLDRDSAIPDTDALITNEPDILLAMYFADCVPLYFYDPATNALGLAHAGWKGTVANVAAATIEAMRNHYGTKPEDLMAAVGPSIGACCYEVDEAVLKHVRPLAAELEDIYQADASPLVTNAKEGHARLNLKEFNRHLMIKAGILPSRIEMTTWCTGCRTDIFFSHRQENGATGRMMSWLGRRGEYRHGVG
ncbi:peptidoglycan editing factor PgeF [Cohnella sp. AR92]|uniref:peptidoglycan editing factor PgeF n=1 Tax=Cohnella sp. AR92 TaxID=648716 RepID=UPI000F8E4015|nr:peptidoglycan editing factor PgeF [Cohnella sp. AR92]RUS48422.1 peptidoglycan editing factor PgeF [Cohnella sp. AR92]